MFNRKHPQFAICIAQFINYFSIPFGSFVSLTMMKHCKKYTATLLGFLLTGFSSITLCQETPLAVYEGSTACDAYVRQLTGIPANLPCEKIKWKLSLFRSNKYKATLTYGLQAIGNPGFIENGKSFQIEGNWTNSTGTPANPFALVYELGRGKNQPPVLLVKIDESILHFLFSDRKLLIGNAGYGYALNRIQN